MNDRDQHQPQHQTKEKSEETKSEKTTNFTQPLMEIDVVRAQLVSLLEKVSIRRLLNMSEGENVRAVC